MERVQYREHIIDWTRHYVVILSSTYLFHLAICVDNFGITSLSTSTIKIPTITCPKGDPIATPSFDYTTYYHRKNVPFWYIVAKYISFLFSISLFLVLSDHKFASKWYWLYNLMVHLSKAMPHQMIPVCNHLVAKCF